jgi:uncharacterized protein YhdP
MQSGQPHGVASAPVADPATAASSTPASPQWRVSSGGLQALLRTGPAGASGGAGALQGAVALDTPLRPPERGLQIMVGSDRVDADAWRRLAARLQAASGGGAGSDDMDRAQPADAVSVLPDLVTLRSRELLLFGQRLSAVQASLRRDERRWVAQVQADQVEGQVRFDPSDGTPGGRLHARLSKLVLPAADRDTAASSTPASGTASSGSPPAATGHDDPMPALDIDVQQVLRRGRDLGRLQVRAEHPLAAPGDWTLEDLRLSNPHGEFTATGRWQRVDPTALGPRALRRMTLDFTLDAHDSGGLLSRFGLDGALTGGAGRVQGELGWRGSPIQPDLASLDGELTMEIGQGRFLKAEPGVGRLLSVLSLQALPRRLLFDFDDVFGDGFKFDAISGTASVSHGVASTQNLRMRGPQAAVQINGSVSLPTETQDLRAVVVPDLDAGAASLAYAAMVNPAVGLGAFLAQILLRKPIAAAGTREFRVTGTWAEPKVDRVDRLPVVPSAPAAPASAASSPTP